MLLDPDPRKQKSSKSGTSQHSLPVIPTRDGDTGWRRKPIPFEDSRQADNAPQNLGIQLDSSLIGHVSINKASKHPHMRHIGLHSTPRLLRSLALKCLSRTLVSCIGRSHHCFRPQLQVQFFGKEHAPSYLYQRAIHAFRHTIQL